MSDSLEVRIINAANNAHREFWRTVAERFPEITTGDSDYVMVHEFITVTERAIRSWVMGNTPPLAPLPTHEYLVRWEIDVPATSHREAAEIALSMQRGLDSLARVFEAIDTDLHDPSEDWNWEKVDLNDLDPRECINSTAEEDWRHNSRDGETCEYCGKSV